MTMESYHVIGKVYLGIVENVKNLFIKGTLVLLKCPVRTRPLKAGCNRVITKYHLYC